MTAHLTQNTNLVTMVAMGTRVQECILHMQHNPVTAETEVWLTHATGIIKDRYKVSWWWFLQVRHRRRRSHGGKIWYKYREERNLTRAISNQTETSVPENGCSQSTLQRITQLLYQPLHIYKIYKIYTLKHKNAPTCFGPRTIIRELYIPC